VGAWFWLFLIIFLIFFFQFCDVAEAAIWWFSQIWLQIRYESTKKNQNCSVFLAIYWNLSYKSDNLKFYFILFWNLMNLGHFFSMKNPLCKSKYYFWGWNLGKFCRKQKHWVRGILKIKGLWQGDSWELPCILGMHSPRALTFP